MTSRYPLSFLLILLVLLVAHFSSSAIFVTSSSSSPSSKSTSCTFQTQRVQCGSLTCNTSTHECIPCTASAQCYNPGMVCLPLETGRDQDQRCVVMDAGSLMSTNPVGFIAAILLCICALTVGVIGGVGAGAIVTVLYQVLLGIPFTEAVALSQATIAGQSSFNVLILMRRFHPNYQPPKATRPIINYTLIAFWLPITLAGTSIGNLMGHVFADWHRVVLLLLLLSYALKRLIEKTMAQKQEDDAKKAEVERSIVAEISNRQRSTNGAADKNDGDDNDDDDDEEVQRQQNNGSSGLLTSGSDKESRVSTKPKAPKQILDQLKKKSKTAQEVDSSLIMMGNNASSSASRSLSENSNSEELQERQTLKPSDDNNNGNTNTTLNNPSSAELHQPTSEIPRPPEAVPQYPRLQLVIILITFLPILIANLVKNKWTECGSSTFWLLTIFSILYNLAVAFLYRKHLSIINDRISVGEVDSEMIPFKWNDKITIYFPLISTLAGVGASATGIGGGIVLGFLLVEAGLVPEEVSATGGFATFAVSIEALLQFVIQGAIRVDYFGIFFLSGLIATSLGQLVIMPEIKRRGWRFLIFGCLGIVMLGSMLAVSIFGIVETVELVKADANVGFGSLCHHRSKVHTAG